MLSESALIDPLEAQIIRCLQLAPRIPFAAVGAILDVSEQTVARRYRRMVKAGVVRVTAVIRPAALGQSNWIVRIQCKPSGAVSLAQALAQRDDISWVTLVSGGAEIICVLRSRTEEARDELLMQRLPRTAPVLGMSAAMVLHRFVGGGNGPRPDWSGLTEALDGAQERAALVHAEPSIASEWGNLTLSAEDLTVLDVLAGDGRASYAVIAAAVGITEARAARRVRSLIEQGAAYYDVDIAVAALGFHIAATLWLTVTPAELDRAGNALSGADEVAFAAAITGPQNLTATLVCKDIADLYSFVTKTVGPIPGVQSLDVSPVLRHVKQAGALTDGDRLEPV